MRTDTHFLQAPTQLVNLGIWKKIIIHKSHTDDQKHFKVDREFLEWRSKAAVETQKVLNVSLIHATSNTTAKITTATHQIDAKLRIQRQQLKALFAQTTKTHLSNPLLWKQGSSIILPKQFTYMWLHYHNRVWLNSLPRNRLTTVSNFSLLLSSMLMPVIQTQEEAASLQQVSSCTEIKHVPTKTSIINTMENKRNKSLFWGSWCQWNALQISQDSTIFESMQSTQNVWSLEAARQRNEQRCQKLLWTARQFVSQVPPLDVIPAHAIQPC